MKKNVENRTKSVHSTGGYRLDARKVECHWDISAVRRVCSDYRRLLSRKTADAGRHAARDALTCRFNNS